MYNNIIVGPTAEDIPERQHPKTEPEVEQKLVEFAYRVLPALRQHKPVTFYAGIRPATQYKDYQIYANKEK